MQQRRVSIPRESVRRLGSDTTGSVAQAVPQGQAVSRVESRPLAPQGPPAQPIQPATKRRSCNARRRLGGAQARSRRQLELGRRQGGHRGRRRHHRCHRAPAWRARIRHHPGQQYRAAGDYLSGPAAGHSALQHVAGCRRGSARRSPADARSGRSRERAPVAAGTSGVHVVAAGDTLSKIARHYHKPVSEIIKANNIQANATLTSATAW